MKRDAATLEAKRLNIPVLIGAKCSKAGHRLRTPSGHCVQCSPASLRYYARHREKSGVYVAHSPSNGLTKIGVSNQIDVREQKIKHEQYAGANDWEILFSIVVKEAGLIESTAQRKLSDFRWKSIYKKDGTKDQMAKEAFKCNPLRAVDEVLNAININGSTHEKPYISPKLRKLQLDNR